MARTIANLLIKLGGDSVEIDRMSKKVQKNFQTMAKDLSDFGKKFSLYVTTPLAAGATISVRNADVQMQAEAKLLKALNGRADIQRRLIEQAAQLQNQSTVGDETIIKQQAYFASLGLTEEQIRKATEASVEMEAVFGDMGINMESAAKSIGVMFGGLLGELGEKIPQLKQFTAEELKAGKGLEYLLETYGGTAKYMAGEGLNPVKQMQNALGDLSEEVGKILLPVIKQLSVYLKGMIGAVQNLSPEFKQMAVAIAGVVAVAGPLLTMLPKLAAGIMALTTPIGIVAAALAALSAGFVAFKAAEQEYLDGLVAESSTEELQNLLDTVRKNLGQFPAWKKVAAKIPTGPFKFSDITKELSPGFEDDIMAIRFLTRQEELLTKAIEQKKKEEKQAQQFEEQARKAAITQTDELLKLQQQLTAEISPNVSTEEIALGSIKALRAELNALQDAYDGAATSAERYRIAAQMKRVEQSLNMAMADGTGTVVRPAGTAGLFHNTFESVGSISFDPSVLAGSREKWAAAGQAIQNNLQTISSQAMEYMNRFNQVLSNGLSSLAVSLAEGIGEAFGGMGIESLGDNIIVAVGNLISSLGALLITYATTMKAFKVALGAAFASPWTALAVGAAMVVTGTAMAAAIKNKAEKGVALAEGGLAFGPTMALVGDNRGAGSDPEVIAPLSKLRQYGLGANDVRVSGRFVVNGSDLLLVLDREKSRQQRMNG